LIWPNGAFRAWLVVDASLGLRLMPCGLRCPQPRRPFRWSQVFRVNSAPRLP
jgi:hypothetical protein